MFTMRSFASTLSVLLYLFLAQAEDTTNRSALRGARNLQDGRKYEKRIPASDFVEMKGATDSIHGLTWLDKGSWVKYEVDLPEAGQYLLEARISSPSLGGALFNVVNPDTSEVYASLKTMPNTSTWEEYASVEVELMLPKGLVPLTLQVVTEGWSLLWLALREMDDIGASPISDPAPDTPLTPTINVTSTPAINVTSNTTRSGTLVVQPYRTMIASATYSEMEGMLVEESTEGLKNLYWIDRGDYATYPIQLPVGGTFLFKARLSSPDGTGAFQVRNKVSEEIYASITELPSTGSFQTWETITTTVELPAGGLVLEIRALSQGWNLLWIVLEHQPEPLIDVTSPVVFANNSGGN